MQTPSSPEIEKTVLACALNDTEALALVCEKLSEDDFYDEKHRLIYRTVASMFSSDTPVDLLTVGDEMDLKEFTHRIGGKLYLTEIATSFITATNTDHYINRLKDVTLRRKLFLESNHLLRLATDNTVSADEALSAAQNRLISIRDGRGARENLNTIVDVASDWMNPERKLWFKSGYEQWDKHMYGWRPGMWYVMAADQNVGKSAWAQNVFLNALRLNEDLAGVYFTYDDDVPPTLARMVTSLCGGLLTIKEVEELHKQSEDLIVTALSRVDRIHDRMKNGTMSIYGNTHTDISDILSVIKRVKRETGKTVMVVLDSVQHVSVNNKNDMSDTAGVSATSKAIHRITKMEGVIMVTTSQINKRQMYFSKVENKYVHRLPNIDDMPYGKQLAFDAAWVGLMSQDLHEPVKLIDFKEWYHNRMFVAKNKTGPYKDRSIHLVINGECCQVREC